MWPSVDVVLVTAIAVATIGPVVVRVVRGRFDPFEPIVLFAVAYGFMFVVRPTAMLARDELVFDSARRALDVEGTFTEMLFVALLGAVAFVVGYESSVGGRLARRHRPPAPLPDARAAVGTALAFGLAGLIAYLLVLASSGLPHSVSAIFRSGNTQLPDSGSASMYASFLFLLLVPASVVALALGLERRRTNFLLVAGSLAAAFALFAVPSGWRVALLPLVGGAAVLWYLVRRARPSTSTLAVVAVLALVGATFMSDLRGRTTRGEGVVPTIQRSTSPSRLLDAVTLGPDTEMAPALAAALAVIPETSSHTYGSTILGDLVSRPVPRSLWPDKPLIPRHELLRTVWPVEYQRGTINAEFSILLYFYWDFGLMGVVAGLAGFGVLARYLYRYLLRFPESAYARVVYSLGLWFVVIGLRDSPVDTFVRACFVLLPVWGIFRIARVVTRRSRSGLSAGPRPAL